MSLLTSQPASGPLTLEFLPRKKSILFLEQQSWLSGGQKVLEFVLDAITPEFESIVALPNEGPFSKKLRDRNIDTILFPLGTYRSGQKSYAEMAKYAGRSLACGLKLAAFIRRKNVALVYVNGPRCLAAGVMAARLTGRPLLFHLHLTLCRKPEVMLVAQLARHAAKIISCSQATAQVLLRGHPALSKSLLVVNNPLSIVTGGASQFAHILSPPAPFTVGMVARISESKGQLSLLNAVGALPPGRREQVRLVLVGAPPPGNAADLDYVGRLKERAAQLNLDQRTFWAGYQPDPTPFYKSMDVLVSPSTVQEGMPMSILEAQSQGIPVIASCTGGIPEIIRHGVNGLLFPPGNDHALTQLLREFLEDSSLRVRLRAGTRSALGSQFSMEYFRSQILKSVQQLSSSEDAAEALALREEPVA
jgi:glycosyltransferase involved in cell wall biosynthesis